MSLTGDSNAALGAAEFGRLLTALGPFGKPLHLAVACSGGADSLALTLLADAWVRRRGGVITALTVDHGLRRASAAEARRVGAWLQARGIAHHVLRWRGAKPKANVAAAARAARYDLLLDWCRRRRIGDLLLAHQQEDQAETFLLRLARGSGADGLAAMAPVVASGGVRLLRPLLGIARARLRATLVRQRQEWIEDPSNEDPAYARSRMRKLLPALAEEGLTPARLAATATRMSEVRAALEAATAALIAATATLNAAGFALLDPAPLSPAPREISLRVLSRLLMLLGGNSLPPRLERLERLLAAILAGEIGAGRTLAGCRLLPSRDRLLICREPAAMAGPLALRPGHTLLWDERFMVTLQGVRAGGGLRVGGLGTEAWRDLAAARPELRDVALPGVVRPTLPALWDLDGVLTVPHLHYRRGGTRACLAADFRPLRLPSLPRSPVTAK